MGSPASVSACSIQGHVQRTVPQTPQHSASWRTPSFSANPKCVGDAKDRLVEHGCLPKIKDGTRFLVINDEAQFLGDQFNGFFQSKSSSENSSRPLLFPILHAFRDIGKDQLTLVTCGTGLSIEDILAKGSTSYWSEAIKRRLSATVCHPGRFPMHGNLCSHIKRMLHKVARDPSKYADAVDLKHVLKQTVVLRVSLGLPWSLRGMESILVESGFGRLRIAADKSTAGKTISTVIDEPFVFQAAYNFIMNEDEGFYKQFREQYRGLQDPQTKRKIFERQAPLELIYAFHNKQLKQELFSIPKAAVHRSTTEPKTPLPKFEPDTFPRRLFEHPATIVGWEEYEWGARYKGVLTMGDFLAAHCNHGSRRGDSKMPPFYYPELSLSGPDIVFVLRIDDQLYPVFVQTEFLDDISPGYAEEDRLIVHETELKAHLPNLATYCPGGKYLSLIYLRPAIFKTPREGLDDDDLWDSESEVGTDQNQDFKDGDMPLMQLHMITYGSTMREFVPEGVVDLLDSLEGVKRVHDQLGSSGRADKKPMLTKQQK